MCWDFIKATQRRGSYFILIFMPIALLRGFGPHRIRMGGRSWEFGSHLTPRRSGSRSWVLRGLRRLLYGPLQRSSIDEWWHSYSGGVRRDRRRLRKLSRWLRLMLRLERIILRCVSPNVDPRGGVRVNISPL